MTRTASIDFTRRGRVPDHARKERQIASKVKHKNAVAAVQRSLEPAHQRAWAYRHARGCQQDKSGLDWMQDAEVPRNDVDDDLICLGKNQLSLADRTKMLLRTRDWGLYKTSPPASKLHQHAPAYHVPSPRRSVHVQSPAAATRISLPRIDKQPIITASDQPSPVSLTNSSLAYMPLHDENHEHNAEESHKSILYSPEMSSISHHSTGSSIECNYDEQSSFSSIYETDRCSPNPEYSLDVTRDPLPLAYDSYPMNDLRDRQQLVRAVYTDQSFYEPETHIQSFSPQLKRNAILEDFFNHFTPSQAATSQTSPQMTPLSNMKQVPSYNRSASPLPPSQASPEYPPGLLSFHHPCMDAMMGFPYVYQAEVSKYLPSDLRSVETGWPYNILAGV